MSEIYSGRVLLFVVVPAVWLVLGGLVALVLSRILRVRDRHEPRPRTPGGSATPVIGGAPVVPVR